MQTANGFTFSQHFWPFLTLFRSLAFSSSHSVYLLFARMTLGLFSQKFRSVRFDGLLYFGACVNCNPSAVIIHSTKFLRKITETFETIELRTHA